MACNLLIFNDPEIARIGQKNFFDSRAILFEIWMVPKDTIYKPSLQKMSGKNWRGETPDFTLPLTDSRKPGKRICKKVNPAEEIFPFPDLT
jgi:hypothetical protein